MKIEDIMKEWSADAPIDATNIYAQSLDTCRLHSKYMNLYVPEKLKHEALQIDYAILKKDRHKFYHRMAEPKVYDDYDDKDGFFDKKILNTDKHIFIDADKELIDYKKKLLLQKEKVELLHSILQMITKRSFDIKNHIEHAKFQHGA